MRLILIPGLGEDEHIFDHLIPLLPGEKIILNSWKIASDVEDKTRNAFDVANEIIVNHQITRTDVVLGHSMGGFIAVYIKLITGCTIVHISSWTNKNRIYWPVIDHPFIYWLVKKRLVFNRFAQKLLLLIFYHKRSSQDIFLYVTDLLIKGNKNNVNNQLRIIFKRAKVSTTLQPDLRIHGSKDTIVKPPKERFYKVDGDHFSLYTHPHQVAAPILDLLNKISK